MLTVGLDWSLHLAPLPHATPPLIHPPDHPSLSLSPVSPFQISLNTRDVFIECTATDLTKAKVVLNTVACMFAAYCSVPFEVEPVEVVDAFGEVTGEGGGGGGGDR